MAKKEEIKDIKESSEHKTEKSEHKSGQASGHIPEHHQSNPESKSKDSCSCKHVCWKKISIILALLVIVSIFTQGFYIKTSAGSSGISESEAKIKVSGYIENLVGTKPEITDIKKTNGLYSFNINLNNQVFESYLSIDGSFLFPSAIDLTKAIQKSEAQKPKELPKTDKPKIELFVMSYCLFGIQVEKGIIPVIEALKDKIDFELKFVNYAMHGEKEIKEQLSQYCIQKEQGDKFLTYLKCFLKAGESESCLAETKIDTANLKSCTEKADKEFKITENLNNKEAYKGSYPPFDIYSEENVKYGVQGSPTLIINGVEADSGRDSAGLLKTICSSFTTAPKGCETKLSSAQPTSGFGFETQGTGSADTASQCG